MKIDLSQLITAEHKAGAAMAARRRHYLAAVEAQIETVAQSRQFSGALSLASYTESTNPVWQAEARTFVAWRDAIWAYALARIEDVAQNTATAPSPEDFLADAPEICWPC
jgi:hypothetical protein